MVLLGAPAAAAGAVDLRHDACFATSASESVDPARLAYACTPMSRRDGWVWLRVDPAAVAVLPAAFELVVGQARLAHLVVVTRGPGGTSDRSIIDAAAVTSSQWAFGGLFRVTVDRPRPVTAMFIGFDRLQNIEAIRRIEAMPPQLFRTQQWHWLLVAGLFIGGVGASLAGSLFFYRAMRLRSHLWYAGWAVIILGFGCYRTNLVFAINPVTDSNAIVRACLLLIAAATASSVMFFISSIEPDILPRRFRRATTALAFAGPLVAIVSTLDRWIDPRPAVILLGAVMVAQLASILVGMAIAAAGSSRAVRFYAIASVPAIIGLLLTITGYYAAIGHSHAIDTFTMGALTFQAIMLFVGHADRFAILHREHRAATNEQAILRRLTEVVFEISPDSCWAFLNPAWEDLSGERIEESIGRPLSAYLRSEDYLPVAAGVAALQRGEIAEYRGVVRFTSARGDIRWISLRLHLRTDKGGKPIGTGGSFYDITEAYLSRLALAASEQRHRALSETSIAAIFECGPDWQVRYTNPAFSRISGLTAEQALGYGWLEALRPDYRSMMLARMASGDTSAGPRPSRTLCYVHPDGTERWCLSAVTSMVNGDGRVTGYCGVTLDITEQHLARDALTASETRFEALARLSPAVIFRTDAKGHCSFANDAWTTLTGRSPQDALGTGYVDAVDPLDRQRLDRAWRTIARIDAAESAEYRFSHVDGSVRWTTIATAREVDADGGLVGFVGVITDITAQKTLEHDLKTAQAAAELAATTDDLTGLANRRQFMTRLTQSVARHKDGNPPVLAMIDVDFFKRINDTLGHPSGDEVLRAVARILRAHIRSTDVIGRVGGEEFALLMPGTDWEAAEEMCERIRGVIATSCFGTEGGTVMKVTVSVGVAKLMPGETISDLISRADKALYLSKNAGRNQVRVAA